MLVVACGGFERLNGEHLSLFGGYRHNQWSPCLSTLSRVMGIYLAWDEIPGHCWAFPPVVVVTHYVQCRFGSALALLSVCLGMPDLCQLRLCDRLCPGASRLGYTHMLTAAASLYPSSSELPRSSSLSPQGRFSGSRGPQHPSAQRMALAALSQRDAVFMNKE